jgi:hypothetical protein
MNDNMLLLPEVPEDDAVERAARAYALRRLRTEIAGAQAETAPPRAPGTTGRRRPRALVLAFAGLAAAATAAVVALTSGLDEGRVTPADSSAAAILRRTAAAAEHAPAPGALAAGQFLYVRRTAVEPRTIHRGGETFVVFVRYLDEDWTARDGSGRNRSTPAAPGFPTIADRAAWERAGRPSTRTMVGNYLPIVAGTDAKAGPLPRHAFPARAGGAGLSYGEVRALPSDPEQLERRLRARLPSVSRYTPQTRAGVARTYLLEWIGRLLGGVPLDGAQRAALLRVAAAQPGVRVSHDAVDRLGRGGTAVRLDVRAVLDPSRPPHRALVTRRSTTLIVDEASGALLGTRTLARDANGRTVGDFGAVYRTTVVDSVTRRHE